METKEPNIVMQQSLDEHLNKVKAGFSVRNMPVVTYPIYEDEAREDILEKTELWANNKNPNKKYSHIGLGGCFNFDVLLKGKHDLLVLADCNEDQIKFHQDFIGLLKKFDSRRDCYLDISRKMDKTGGYFDNTRKYTLDTNEEVNLIIFKDDSGLNRSIFQWLNKLTDDDYNYLHNIACEGKILAVVLDAYHAGQNNALCEWFNGNNFAVRSVYASNIKDYEKNNSGFFDQNIPRSGDKLAVLCNDAESEVYYCEKDKLVIRNQKTNLDKGFSR